jgi:hypothetical protein
MVNNIYKKLVRQSTVPKSGIPNLAVILISTRAVTATVRVPRVRYLTTYTKDNDPQKVQISRNIFNLYITIIAHVASGRHDDVNLNVIWLLLGFSD